MRQDMDSLSVATMRMLATSAVEKVCPGHPGTPVALAPVAHAPWLPLLRHRAPLGPGGAKMIVAIAADHAGFALADSLRSGRAERGVLACAIGARAARGAPP